MGSLLCAFAVWTATVWAVRVVMIAIADHTVAFKVVHVVLGLISVALTIPAWRVGREARARWSADAVAG